ncbi:MAG: M15 family metallopeptidase [Treponema sp.]|nr:M15 family metallopeptidase [Treponema sp.]
MVSLKPFLRGLLWGLVLLWLILPGDSGFYAGENSQKRLKSAVPSQETLPPDRSPEGLEAALPEGRSIDRELPENGGMAGASDSPLMAGDSAVLPGEIPASGAPPPMRQPSRGELVMKALAQAYPDRIGPAEFRDEDWAVPIGEAWFYYAEGRLLPQELRAAFAEYDPQPFYNYPADLPPWKAPTAEEGERIRSQTRRRLQHPPKRSQHFYDTLWRASSRNEAWDRVKSLRFLGRPVYVHYSILEELALVEERIIAESRTNGEIKRWIDSLEVLDGWNWRSIADTQSRSFHAYGAALDLLPKSGGKESYWAWTSRTKSDWWTVPYSQRLHPPDVVIKAFEAYGFVWGGKWMYYDTMHFEYRPEIFILSGLPLTAPR